jgi:predicted RNA-binding Zn ribbon-like protein
VSALRLSPELAAWAELAAALVNTGPRLTDPPEKLAGVEDVDRLLAACPEPAPATTQRSVTQLRRLRPALLRAFEAETLDAFAEAVNPLLERTATGWQMAPAAGGGWTLGPAGRQDLAGWFGARATRGLAELAIAYGIERLHLCRADDCLRAVVDVSRNGTRRYCSRTCANRTNVRRHRQTR